MCIKASHFDRDLFEGMIGKVHERLDIVPSLKSVQLFGICRVVLILDKSMDRKLENTYERLWFDDVMEDHFRALCILMFSCLMSLRQFDAEYSEV
jgi:hypothetical protein